MSLQIDRRRPDAGGLFSLRRACASRFCRAQRRLLAAPPERDAIGSSANARQRIVGELDTGSEARGHEQHQLLRLRTVGRHFSQRQYAELDDLAVIRPRLARILGLIAGLSQLRLQVKNQRLLRDPLGKLVEQIIRWLLGRLFGRDVHQLVWRYYVAYRLPLAALVDEDESVNAVVLLVGKAVRDWERTDRLRRIRMAGEELVQFRGLWGIGWTRDDGLQQITKVLSGPYREELERVGHHVGVGSAGQVVLDGDATGHRGRAVGHSRHPTAIREARGHRN